MTINVLTVPKFNKGQEVKFLGGVGIIENYRQESDYWIYLVVMPMKLEPKVDRVGNETMLWLSEEDISSLFN